MRRLLFFILPAVCVISCHQRTNTLFTDIKPDESNIHFRNDIQEDADYNILTYEYLYNGGGVAVGDLNNDGLADIMFTGNMVPNQLYLNKGGLKFEEVAEKAGVTGRSKWKTGVVMADVNGDGMLDIYVCYSGPGSDAERSNELYINKGVMNGVPVFTESAKQYGLDAPGTYSTTAVFFDMDNDGDLDMFLVNHADMFYNPYFNTEKLREKRNPKYGNRLYRNDDGHFTDISEQAHIDGSGLNFGLSASVSDVNGDGWPDIYVTNDYDERDFLYLNNRDGTFREVLAKAAGHISQFAMGSDIADFNNDDRTDIMVLDMLPEGNHRQKLLRGADEYDKYQMRVASGFHHQQMRNTLQLNNGVDSVGIPVFSEIGQMAGVSATDWSWAPLFADFDNDGRKDLFISNGILRDMTNLDFVKYTSGYSSQYDQKSQDKSEMWKLVKDMPSTKLRSYVYRNTKNLGFTDESENWGLTKSSINNGAVYADLDNDGDLDLVVSNLNDVATIYRNNTSENTKAHYLRLRLKAYGQNTFGLGAKVLLNTAHNHQLQEEYVCRGFQSSVDPIMHIGLGRDSMIENLQIKWPDGKSTFLQHFKGDTLLVIDENSNSIQDTAKKNVPRKKKFEDITTQAGINFSDLPNPFVDFKISPLLPYQLSKTGPCITKADVNRDGLEDIFIGATAGQESVLYIQGKDGRFLPAATQPWNSSKDFCNTDAIFFDADGDGDPDPYLVSGGVDYPLNSKNYQDRIFENDGHGNFKSVENALPPETISGSCARASDINHDGLLDLFVGGKYKPGFFPESPESFVLKNVSSPGAIRFVKDKQQKDSMFSHPGMVTDACWVDLNRDGWQDLVVVGLFMPICVFENERGQLVDQTAAYGLGATQGWWNRIQAGDFNHDGDTDLVVGNLGLNTQLKASDTEPLKITFADFNGDGVIDPLLTYYNQGKSYPYFSRDEILKQIPSLQKKFARYADYADAQLEDLFETEALAKANSVQAKMLQSVFLRNEGTRKMTVQALPAYAQISAVNGIIVEDVDHDGNPDIILAGNCFTFRAQLGPLDGSMGMVLKNDGKGGFTPMLYPETGLFLREDVRNLIKVRQEKNTILVATKNNGPVQVVRLDNK